MTLGLRWLKFNAVGLIGIGVQLGALALFTKVLGWNYLLGTALAVETAVLHNFGWHEIWTWSDRRQNGSSVGARLLRFHAGNGLVSIVLNVVLMRVFAGALGWPVMVSNLASIAITSLLNFEVSEFWVFSQRPPAHVNPEPDSKRHPSSSR